MISIEQCRAARGLIGWTQQDLANAAGLSKTAINNFEKGHSDIKIESLRAIRMAFESLNIEFLENDGLQRRKDKIKMLSGPYMFGQLLDDICENISKHGGTLRAYNLCRSSLREFEKPQCKHQLQRLLDLAPETRALSPQSPRLEALMPLNTAEKEIPPALSEAAPTYYIYGHKIAFELKGQSAIIIVENKDVFERYAHDFNQTWENGENYSAQSPHQSLREK